MHVVPRHEVLTKLAAIQNADAVGRQLAQDQAIEKLAGMAGIFMAHTQTEEGMDKLAQAMVLAGELSLEEYEMLKEAGWGSAFKAVGRGVKSVFSRAPATMARGPSRDVAAAVAKPSLMSRVKGIVSRKPKAVAGTPGSVAPASKPMTGSQYNRSSSRSAGPKVAPTSPGNVTPASGAATDAAGAAAPKKRGWGAALPWMAVGGAGYGLYKGVPWAARQLEASSTTPMAYGGGWSPVPYGYGHSPYGAGVPTMGPGA
jgi:hypothetical protein